MAACDHLSPSNWDRCTLTALCWCVMAADRLTDWYLGKSCPWLSLLSSDKSSVDILIFQQATMNGSFIHYRRYCSLTVDLQYSQKVIRTGNIVVVISWLCISKHFLPVSLQDQSAKRMHVCYPLYHSCWKQICFNHWTVYCFCNKKQVLKIVESNGEGFFTWAQVRQRVYG